VYPSTSVSFREMGGVKGEKLNERLSVRCCSYVLLILMVFFFAACYRSLYKVILS
jgi:hypothetical protein